jgi:hypothetical protein
MHPAGAFDTTFTVPFPIALFNQCGYYGLPVDRLQQRNLCELSVIDIFRSATRSNASVIQSTVVGCDDFVSKRLSARNIFGVYAEFRCVIGVPTSGPDVSCEIVRHSDLAERNAARDGRGSSSMMVHFHGGATSQAR